MYGPIIKTIAFLMLLAGTAAAEDLPLDILQKTAAPFMPADDPLAFPLKVRYMITSPRALWGGGKELFFLWCKDNAAGWLADQRNYVVQHGDQHLSNIGTYLPAGEFARKFPIGLIDYDDTHRLPFQIELLQCAVGLRLAVGQAKVPAGKNDMEKAVEILIDSYRASLNSKDAASKMLKNDPMYKKFMGKAMNDTYDKHLARYTDGNGRFRRIIRDSDGEISEVLHSEMDQADVLAAGIADALGRQEDLRKAFCFDKASDIRKAVRDIALRINLGGAGSQGQRKYLILLKQPLAAVDHDIILYAKEQIPASPERAGLIGRDPRLPAQRCVEDTAVLCDPRPFACTWFEMNKVGYVLTIHEPWGKGMEPSIIDNIDELHRVARIWGLCAGATHRQEGQPQIILDRLNGNLKDDLVKLSEKYLHKLQQDYAQFKGDSRADALAFAARKAIAAKARGQ